MMKDSVSEIDEEKEIAFINLKFQDGKIVEFAAISARLELLRMQVVGYMRVEIEPSKLSMIHSMLDEKVWIFHKIEIEKLIELFRESGHTIPEAILTIDTKDWFRENFAINDDDLEAAAQYFGVNYGNAIGRNCEDIPRVLGDCYLHLGRNCDDIPRVLGNCFLHLEVYMVSLAAKGLEEIMAENSSGRGGSSRGRGRGSSRSQGRGSSKGRGRGSSRGRVRGSSE